MLQCDFQKVPQKILIIFGWLNFYFSIIKQIKSDEDLINDRLKLFSRLIDVKTRGAA